MPTIIAHGARASVFAARASGGRELAIEFLDDLDPKLRARMVRLCEKLAEGHRLSREDFRKLQGDIFELKDHRRRMLCFSAPDGWYLTHGFEKKTSARTPRKEIERAERVRREHLNQT